MITQNLSLNLIPSGVPQRINVSQYDNGETIAVTLYNGATPFTLPSGATVYVSGTKADNTGFEYACSTSSGVSFTITDQMTVFAGEVTCELSIYQGNNRLSTINFILNVEKAALSEDTEISQTDIPIIENIPQYVTQAANSADLAHKWATFGVASEQPSASNNAKYWAQVAQQTEIGQATTVAYTPDTAPYSFRRSTHNAVYDKLVGISWVENQLMDSDTPTTTTAGRNYYKWADGIVVGHKYLVIVQPVSSNAIQIWESESNTGSWGLSENANSIATIGVGAQQQYRVVSPTQYSHICARTVNNTSIAELKWQPMLIDLTLMFGASIADKIYTMEQATAGSGLAWIRQYGFLTGKYIAYNVGQIKSAKPKWRKVVGFNVWDEVWENGALNGGTGATVNSSTQIRAKNYIPVVGNTEYYVKGGSIWIAFFDESKNIIPITTYAVPSYVIDTSANLQKGKNSSVYAPQNAYYARFYTSGADYGNTYNYDICINVSDSQKNGIYKPYTPSITYPLGSDELRGVPTLSGNNLVADGDVKTSDGVVNTKYVLYHLGDLTYTYQSSGQRFSSVQLQSAKIVLSWNGVKSINSKYALGTVSSDGSGGDKILGIYEGVVYIRDTAYTDPTDLKAALNGVYLVVEAKTPTTSVSTPFTSPQVSLVTEETDTICGHDSVVVDIPEWMRNQYFDDVRAEASKAELLEQFLDIKVEDKTSGGYARFKRCGNHVECTINSYSVTDGGAGIEVPEQFRTSVAEYGFAFASTESAAVAVTYAPSTNKLTFRNANLTSYATGNMHGSISWYIE